MRFNTHRLWLGAVALLCGILFVASSPSQAGDVPDEILKSIIEADVKRVNEMVEKYNTTPDKKMPIQIKSSSLMIAAYAQNSITGKDAAADKKWAGVRDQAIKVAESFANKKSKEAVAIDLSKGEGDPKPVKIHTMAKMDIDILMAQFKKSTAEGLNMEADIKEGANKGAKVDATLIAGRALVTADFLAELTPTGGFDAKKTKKDWDRTTGQMKTAARDILAAKGKDGKTLTIALKKLDGACTACHNIFKE